MKTVLSKYKITPLLPAGVFLLCLFIWQRFFAYNVVLDNTGQGLQKIGLLGWTVFVIVLLHVVLRWRIKDFRYHFWIEAILVLFLLRLI